MTWLVKTYLPTQAVCGGEDKKHGYGVLFYRNGGVYVPWRFLDRAGWLAHMHQLLVISHHQVGQWMNNQKHGLGVLLDSNSQELYFLGWMVVTVTVTRNQTSSESYGY